MKKGDIFWADNVPTVSVTGEVFYKKRPVVVFSNSNALSSSGIAQVLPLTSKIQKATQIPTHVVVKTNGTMLTAPSVIMPEQLCTISQKDFLQFAGKIDASTMRIVESAVKTQLAIS